MNMAIIHHIKTMHAIAIKKGKIAITTPMSAMPATIAKEMMAASFMLLAQLPAIATARKNSFRCGEAKSKSQTAISSWSERTSVSGFTYSQ